jgi:hypothetical protein
MLETLKATRYVTPLREGGSLPALVEADDDGLYVLKFRGAGQGVKALIAELITGEIGRALGLPVPRLAFMQLDPMLGRNEPDSEIRALIESSAGLNFAMDYLPGSISFDPVANVVSSELASAIVWFDAYTMNVDRTARNTNMLMWHKKLYLIDHGASLYFHHNWATAAAKFKDPFSAIKDHVLLRYACNIAEESAQLKSRLNSDVIGRITELIPNDWLGNDPQFSSANEHREYYNTYLLRRLECSEIFEAEAIQSRERLHARANVI